MPNSAFSIAAPPIECVLPESLITLLTSIEDVRALAPRAADVVEAVLAFKIHRPGGELFKASDISTDAWRSRIERDCDTALAQFELDPAVANGIAPPAYRLLHLEGLWFRAVGTRSILVSHIGAELTVACPASADDAKALELSVFAWGFLSASLWDAGFRVTRSKVKVNKTFAF